MTNDFFATLVLGHLVGDYLLQNKWMAMNKSGNWYTCFIHCMIYTATVSLFTYGSIHTFYSFWLWPLAIFATHFPIDYWSLADKWLDFIEGRSIKDFLKRGHDDLGPMTVNMPDTRNHHILRGGFTALVYATADNTMHLVLMYWAAKLIL